MKSLKNSFYAILFTMLLFLILDTDDLFEIADVMNVRDNLTGI